MLKFVHNVDSSVNRKKSANVYKRCPKIISLEKLKILSPLQNLHRNVRDLGKFIVAKSFKKLPKVKKSPNLVMLVDSWMGPMKIANEARLKCDQIGQLIGLWATF